MKKRLWSVLDRLNFVKHFKSMEKSWQVALASAGIIAIMLFLFQSISMVGYKGPLGFLFFALVIFLIFILSASILTLILAIIKKIPTYKFWLLLIIFFLFLIVFISHPTLTFILPLIVLISIGSIAGLAYRYWDRKDKDESKVRKALRIFVLGTSFILLISLLIILVFPGSDELPMMVLFEQEKTQTQERIKLEDPSSLGTYNVKTLTYGSPDNYRDIFMQEDSLISPTFDGSKIIKTWTPLRTKSLGFGPDQMPLNGLVWYPEGDGPFPLVVFVHGNHQGQDYSDPGYAYLAELLASRGFICVSLDQNFINMSFFNNLIFFTPEEDHIVRALLILEHLNLWNSWSQDQANPFFNKVNMDNIGLVGHSRGGEAICLASYLNHMGVLPTDSSIELDYGYNIKALVDAAGVDGSFLADEKSFTLEDIDFLSLHGSHDMDVSYYMAYNQYANTIFSKDSDQFKSSVYIYGANHGQFNEGWGQNDSFGIGSRVYKTANLLARQDQEKIAQVYISAFLDASLKNKDDYKIIFKNQDYAKVWLPETIYITDYWDSNTRLIANFNEDLDFTSASLDSASIKAENFTEWTEEMVNGKYWPENYKALKLSWDSEEIIDTPIYEISISDGLEDIKTGDVLVFSLADCNDDRKNSDPLTDLSIQIEDSNGAESKLALSDFDIIYPRILCDNTKMPLVYAAPMKQTVFQNYAIRLEEFEKDNLDLNIKKINKISLIFDKNPKGSVYIRDIGIRDE